MPRSELSFETDELGRLIARSLPRVETVKDMRRTVANDGDGVVLTESRKAGIFRWQPSNPYDSGSDNAIVVPAHATGYWVRRWDEETILAEWFYQGDLAQAVEQALQAAEQTEASNIRLPSGVHEWTKQVQVTLNNITIFGQDTTLVNKLPERRDSSTLQAMIRLQGSSEVVTQFRMGEAVTRGRDVARPILFLEDNSWASAGDVIGFERSESNTYRSFSEVLNVGPVTRRGEALTIDRGLTNPIQQGARVVRVRPVQGVTISNIQVDLGGQYGYFLWAEYSRSCRTEHVKAENIGSKVINWQRSFECVSEEVEGRRATDMRGGMGYLLRFASCNDCQALRCKGEEVRHTVDLTISSRNLVKECRAFQNGDSDYKTHGNDCWSNRFVDNISIESRKAAYTIVEERGDKHNEIINPQVQRSAYIDGLQTEGTNVFRGGEIQGGGAELIRHGGIIRIENAHLEIRYRSFSDLHSQSELNAAGLQRHRITYRDCTIDTFVNRALGAARPRDYALELHLEGGEVRAHHGYWLFEGNEKSDVYLSNGVRIIYTEPGVSGYAMFRLGRMLRIEGAVLVYEQGGDYVAGRATPSQILLERAEIRGAGQLTRPD